MHMPPLRERRIQRLWSQAELARRSGVAVRTIVNIETGQRLPRLQTMRRIADALEVEWTDIDEFRQAVEDREEKVAA
jgi:transcriptional regulator with XRE-family HTH domain